MKSYYVYILTNKGNRVFYVGVTSNLVKRIYEHKSRLVDGFSSKYELHKLVYFEETIDFTSAIERENKLKQWRREFKIKLIGKHNPKWKDLYE
jgi:putative endonuclease